jgi:hypothetical protein
MMMIQVFRFVMCRGLVFSDVSKKRRETQRHTPHTTDQQHSCANLKSRILYQASYYGEVMTVTCLPLYLADYLLEVSICAAGSASIRRRKLRSINNETHLPKYLLVYQKGNHTELNKQSDKIKQMYVHKDRTNGF